MRARLKLKILNYSKFLQKLNRHFFSLQLSIIAVDGGNLRSGKMTVFLAFVDKTSEPYFESNNWSTSFTENQTGLDEFRVFPEAFDSKNVGVSAEEFEFEIYYYLDGKFSKYKINIINDLIKYILQNLIDQKTHSSSDLTQEVENFNSNKCLTENLLKIIQ